MAGNQSFIVDFLKASKAAEECVKHVSELKALYGKGYSKKDLQSLVACTLDSLRTFERYGEAYLRAERDLVLWHKDVVSVCEETDTTAHRIAVKLCARFMVLVAEYSIPPLEEGEVFSTDLPGTASTKYTGENYPFRVTKRVHIDGNRFLATLTAGIEGYAMIADHCLANIHKENLPPLQGIEKSIECPNGKELRRLGAMVRRESVFIEGQYERAIAGSGKRGDQPREPGNTGNGPGRRTTIGRDLELLEEFEEGQKSGDDSTQAYFAEQKGMTATAVSKAFARARKHRDSLKE